MLDRGTSVGRGCLLGWLALCSWSAPAGAAVDLTGPWRVIAETEPFFNPDVNCIVDVLQVGSSLSVVGNDCTLTIDLTGAINPTTGAFSASGTSDPFLCPTLTITGNATPASDAFNGTFHCNGVLPVSGPFSGGLCANGVVDAAEECDDGNQQTSDCCSPVCEFDPPTYVCLGPDQACNKRRCDGAGTCVATPGPPGVRCESDFNGCTADVCDAGGNCTHPSLPAGSPCVLDFNVCTDDFCDGNGACLTAPNTAPCDDFNSCTVGDQCAAGSCVPGSAFAPPGVSCNTDSDLCTIDECDGSGGCQNVDCSACCGDPSCVEQIASNCATPEEPSAKLQLGRRTDDPERDRLGFKWQGPTSVAAFGDPDEVTDYEVCLYQLGEFPTPRLRYQGRAAAGGTCGDKPCWRASGAGFAFKDPTFEPDGLQLLKLRANSAGAGQVTVKGRGANIGWNRFDFLAPPLTLQVKASNGQCWSASFDSFRKQNHHRLKAVGGQ